VLDPPCALPRFDSVAANERAPRRIEGGAAYAAIDEEEDKV